MSWLSIGITILLYSTSALAVDIQYALVNGYVTGASDTPLASIPDYGIVTLPGATAAQIVWPVPAGCPAGTVGDETWTMLTDPGNVTVNGGGMAVRTGYVFFSTTSTLLPGCHHVNSWPQLRSLYRGAVVQALSSGDYDFYEVLDDVNVAVSRRCPGTTGGANCDTARANMLSLDSEYPGAAGMASFTTQLVTLKNDVRAFKAAQGW